MAPITRATARHLAQDQTRRIHGQQRSSRFLSIPREVRMMIYEMLFRDSRIYFNPIPYLSGQSEPATFTTTGQWGVLLTCKTCYLEGRLIFIRESRLIAHDTGLGGLKALASAVSDFTAANIPHLRNVGYRNNEPSQIVHALTRFPNLETFGFNIIVDALTAMPIMSVYGTDERRGRVIELIRHLFSDDDLEDLIDKKKTETRFLFDVRFSTYDRRARGRVGGGGYHGIYPRGWVLNLNTKEFEELDSMRRQFDLDYRKDVFSCIL